jgi:hypothetical protein
MKGFLLITLFLSFIFKSVGQVKSDDFGKIVLSTYLTDNSEIPPDAKNILLNKLNQITSINGLGGSKNIAEGRFIITANVNIGTVDITPGPPQMIAQSIELTLFIGDLSTSTVYSSLTLSLKGVGSNKNKSFIAAFNTINPNDKKIALFIDEGRNKITNYYITNCNLIISESHSLEQQGKFEEAIYNLSLIPSSCNDCYLIALDSTKKIYLNKINNECNIKINNAKLAWNLEPNYSGATKASQFLNSIDPLASCMEDVYFLMDTISKKLIADEKKKWDLAVEMYRDGIDLAKDKLYLDKYAIESYCRVAYEYARNNRQIINYNSIIWR